MIQFYLGQYKMYSFHINLLGMPEWRNLLTFKITAHLPGVLSWSTENRQNVLGA